MKKAQIKTFLKEHKKEIIGGAVIVIAGGIIGNKYIKLSKECDGYRKVFNSLKEFDNDLIDRLMEMQKDCQLALTNMPNRIIPLNEFGDTVPDLVEALTEEADGELVISGLVMFVKEKE